MPGPMERAATPAEFQLAARIRQMTFRLNFKGYAVGKVDELLGNLVAQLERGDGINSTMLENPRLPKALKGYDIREVDAFLHEISQTASGFPPHP